MILYEFTYTDHLSRPIEQREEGIKLFLEEESLTQGWAPGYAWHLVQTQVEEGFVRYYYQVEGEYLPSSELFDGVMESLKQAQQIARGEKEK